MKAAGCMRGGPGVDAEALRGTAGLRGGAGEQRGFTRQMTLAAKGLATLLLMAHHGLTPFLGKWGGARGAVLANIMSLGKLCVAVFAVLSGYGMFLAYARRAGDVAGAGGGSAPMLRFLVSHILKVYVVFWLTAGLMIVGVSVLRGGMTRAYEGYPAYYLLLDLMALSYPAKSPKFLNSWWYVTATLFYYCLFPLLYPLVRKLRGWSWTLAAAIAAFCLARPGISPVIVYGSCFLAGMTLAEGDLPGRFLRLGEEEGSGAEKRAFRASFRIWKIAACAAILVGLCLARQQLLGGTMREYYLDVLPATALILLTGELLNVRALRVIGSCSFEIYLIHGLFLRTGEGSFYGLFTEGNPIRACLCLMGFSFVLAVLMRRIEKLLRIGALAAWCGGEGGSAEKAAGAKSFAGGSAEKAAKRAKLAAGLLAAAAAALMIPELIANLGIGKLAFQDSEIRIAADARRAAVYSETPLLWDFANKTYRSDDTQLCSFVDGTYFPHYPGETDVTVSLPFGKSATCHVVVLEGSG